jgi:hypothetical protein
MGCVFRSRQHCKPAVFICRGGRLSQAGSASSLGGLGHDLSCLLTCDPVALLKNPLLFYIRIATGLQSGKSLEKARWVPEEAAGEQS